MLATISCGRALMLQLAHKLSNYRVENHYQAACLDMSNSPLCALCAIISCLPYSRRQFGFLCVLFALLGAHCMCFA